MSAITDKLFLYFQYPFVVNALIVGVLIALCSSMLGVTLVLKRYSFIGDGLSHVAFGAMAVAAVAGFTDDMPFILLVTVAFAVLLLRTGQNAKIKGDAAIAMISVVSSDECILFLCQCFRRRLYHPVRFHFHFNADKDAGRDVRRTVRCRDWRIRSLLQQNFCGDI